MPTNLLHLDSSILAENSVSRSLSERVVAQLTSSVADLKVVYRDLACEPLAHLSSNSLASSRSAVSASPIIQEELAVGEAVLREFLSADIVVIGVAFYNFAIPSQLKSWIDRIVIAGRTFRYTEAGPEGLVAGKRVILTIARGGFYGPGTPAEQFEHAESYLRSIFTFLGVGNIEVIAAEGIAIGPQARSTAISQANERIALLT